MSTLKVANIHFEVTGTNRIDYIGDSVIRVKANGFAVPSGSTDDRPLNETGIIRYNTTTNKLECYFSGGWDNIVPETAVNSTNDATNAAFLKGNTSHAAANAAFLNANSAFDMANSKTSTGKAIAMAIVFG